MRAGKLSYLETQIVIYMVKIMLLMYGYESWTISKGMEQKLMAAEVWFWRRMMRISWTDKLNNEAVLESGSRKTTFEHYQKETMELCWAYAEKRRRDREEHLGS